MTTFEKLQAYIDKVDSPERLALFEGVGEQYYADAEFLNLLKQAVLELHTAGPGSIDQNNIGVVFNLGFISSLAISLDVQYSASLRANTQSINILPTHGPVIFTIIVLDEEDFTAKKYRFLFLKGKGNWGITGGQILSAHLEFISWENVMFAELANASNNFTLSLGDLPNHTFLPTLNSQERNFVSPDLEYFISYNISGRTYLWWFKGEKGTYGGNGVPFTAAQFSKVTTSDAVAQLSFTSQLLNNGADGSSPYATVAQVNGLNIVVNQAAAEMYLKDGTGATLATVNLAFLNNEGTTFNYNETTEKLELKNDAGELLSAIPVSAFVSNLIQYADFNASTPQRLEFKSPSGEIIDYVTLTINNVEGLQTALNNKANKDGSNAFGNWPININGQSVTTINWGGSAADLSSDGANLLKLIGTDNVNTARRFTNIVVKAWLAISQGDIAGLVDVLTGKANKDGSNAEGTWGITSANSQALGSFPYLEEYTSTIGSYVVRDGANFKIVFPATIANNVRANSSGTWPISVSGTANNTLAIGGYPYIDGFDPQNTAYIVVRDSNGAFRPATIGQVINTLGITAKANDTDVIHTNSTTETKNGTLVLSAFGIGVEPATGRVMQVRSSNTTQPAGYFYNYNTVAGTSRGIIVEAGSNSQDYAISAGNNQGVNLFIVRGDGNVGLNNANPEEKLHVKGNVLSDGSVSSRSITNNSQITLTTTNTYPNLQASTNNGASPNKMILNRFGGNVGVGPVDPDAALHVNGNVRIETPPAHDKDAVRKIDLAGILPSQVIKMTDVQLSFPTIPANGAQEVSVPWEGTLATDIVEHTEPGFTVSAGNREFSARIYPSGTLLVRQKNYTGSPLASSSTYLSFRILRY